MREEGSMSSRSGPARIRLCLTTTLLALAVVLAATPADAAATWTRVASPNRGTVASALQDVVMVPGATTAWAVGYSYDSNLAAYRTMTQRATSTNGPWTIVPSVNASATGYSQLNRVDATSTGNVWAIGYDTQAGSLVERYNGSSWARMTAPAGISLRGLDVVSPTEVWVAGYAGSAATVAQWRNGTWTTRYTQASTGRHLTVFEAIAVDPAGQVWAVGWDRDYNAPGRPVSSLVVHFDGTGWTREPTPNPADRNTLMDVVAPAGGEVLAVGVAQDVSGGGITPRSLMLRRQGGTWSSLAVPKGEAGSQDQLLSVGAVSADGVWAVGYYNSPSSGLYEPLLVHWTRNAGTGSLSTSQPSPALTVSALASGVGASPAGNLWAVGYTSPPSAGNATLILKGTGG
jgi:hypothetical protein